MAHGGFGGDDRVMGIGEGIQDEQEMEEGVPYQVTMTFLPTGKVGVSDLVPMPMEMAEGAEGEGEEMGSEPDVGAMFPNVDRAVRHVMTMLEGMSGDEGTMEEGYEEEEMGPADMIPEETMMKGNTMAGKKAGAYGR